ncbi:GOLPH3/VPS74 family protein [Phytoactinopolyspora alkaliphila]|uniref:GOLPH3/VPS74 family protein n=1 Tax=Phytoactinopolyspora alkaliphila TaxID=1783498 RepID=UPI001C2079CB|nr:GPP34 family phosphoprotein [Phytoactinopolyspora alkaliphila]
MTGQHEDSRSAPSSEPNETAARPNATLAEDLLLLLFQPSSGRQSGTGSIAGEGTLYYALAGAVLADLGLGGHVRTESGRLGTMAVEAVADNPPSDQLLRASWEYVADKPRSVQTVLAATGPTLREPLLDRLVERGDLRRSTRSTFGLFKTSVYAEGDSGRRDGLMAGVRAVLVDGAEPTVRGASLAALLYGSGTLPQFDRDIPWTSTVIARAEELKEGNWGAGATEEAVTRTVTATIVNNVIVASAALQRG